MSGRPLQLRFLSSATRTAQLPESDAEVAFVGRSNVGKSSLINALANQKQLAERYIAQLEAAHAYPGKIVTQLAPLTAFYPAEGYHQDYLVKNPGGYTCHFVRD